MLLLLEDRPQVAIAPTCSLGLLNKKLDHFKKLSVTTKWSSFFGREQEFHVVGVFESRAPHDIDIERERAKAVERVSNSYSPLCSVFHQFW
jgi:hypothetical protein